MHHPSRHGFAPAWGISYLPGTHQVQQVSTLSKQQKEIRCHSLFGSNHRTSSNFQAINVRQQQREDT